MIVCQLATLLAARGMSRRQLARRAGLNRNTINALAAHPLQRRLEVATLEKLCVALEVQPGKLLRWVIEA